MRKKKKAPRLGERVVPIEQASTTVRTVMEICPVNGIRFQALCVHTYTHTHTHTKKKHRLTSIDLTHGPPKDLAEAHDGGVGRVAEVDNGPRGVKFSGALGQGDEQGGGRDGRDEGAPTYDDDDDGDGEFSRAAEAVVDSPFAGKDRPRVICVVIRVVIWVLLDSVGERPQSFLGLEAGS